MKILLLSILLLASASVASARTTDIDLGDRAPGTPYDRYMSPVKRVLASVQGEEDSMRRVRHLMNVGRKFRYSFNRPYTAMPPEVTERTRTGDCKDKALWLINALNDSSARFVIGKAKANSRISHAWVLWQNEGRWWILDCTNRRDPIPADSVGRNAYIPLYSYAKNGTYQHMGMRFANRSTGREPVASSNGRSAWGNR